MRRKDREVSNRAEIIEIMKTCDVCRIGMVDEEGFAYMVPLNFGLEANDEHITLYFHSAKDGHKIDLMKRKPDVAFEMDCGHELVFNEATGHCTMNFQSVMGRGKISFIDDPEEKFRAMTILTDGYHETHFQFNPKAMPVTAVYKLEVETITAKRKA